MDKSALVVIIACAAAVLLGSALLIVLGKLLPQKPARERRRAKGVYSKVVIVLMIILNVWFADRAFSVLESGGNVSGALIGAWYGFTTGELLACFGIKVTKQKSAAGGDGVEEADEC